MVARLTHKCGGAAVDHARGERPHLHASLAAPHAALPTAKHGRAAGAEALHGCQCGAGSAVRVGNVWAGPQMLDVPTMRGRASACLVGGQQDCPAPRPLRIAALCSPPCHSPTLYNCAEHVQSALGV